MLFGHSSCTGILDTAPYDGVASSTMWKTEALVDQGVAGVYAALKDWGQGNYTGDKVGSTWAFEPWGVAGQCRYGETITNGTVTPGSALFSNTWRRVYEAIHRANDAIANIPESPVSDDKKARLLAEVKFIRAYCYLRLNELFGRDGLGVPLYLEPVNADECNKGQSPESEVWAAIVADLTDCINEANLPDATADGHVSKGAAYALRGKAYLIQGAKYAANGAVTKDDALLTKAIADFDKVDDCGYGLFQGGFKELFTEAQQNCKEMIFSIEHYSLAGYGTLVQKYCGARSAIGISGGTSWGDYRVNEAVNSLFEFNDGSPFSWADADPDLAELDTWTNPNDRAVFFLRDKEDAQGNPLTQHDGTPLPTTVLTKLDALLNSASASAKAKYLPYGNEARIRKAYATRDPRFEASVITPYGTFRGGQSYTSTMEAMDVVYRWPVPGSNLTPEKTQRDDFAPDDANNFTYYHRKFITEGTGLALRDDSPISEPLIRYVDVLLLWAEALIEKGDATSLSQAAGKINEVRGRTSVEMPGVTISNVNDGRAKVRAERRREFVGEGVNFFDEMRWRTWKETKFDRGTKGIWGAPNGSVTYVWAGDYLYVWPVPLTEIQKNSNLTKTPDWRY
jgi:hypothetical protein